MTIENRMANDSFDVAIVGYGPVGQALAAMLGQAGYSVGVFERWPSLYPLPRACVVDHEIMRVLQAIGVAEPFSALAVPTGGEYVWLNARGETLYHFKYDKQGVSGWPARSLMYQPDLEAELDKRVRALPSVEVHQGWEAVAYAETAQGAELVVVPCTTDAAGKIQVGTAERRITARYVVGADGANSFVRRGAQLPWLDLGFRADWLVVDFRPHDPERELDMPEAGQICDPARPITLMRRMGRRHVRWEMMLLPGETAQEITRPERVWPMIARWVAPADGVIDRAAVYTFRSGVAERWASGRAILAGDAAHLMPPFLGQGLCSGLRDALALAWRLQLMLDGKAADALLQSYEMERKAHVSAVIERAVALGKVVCITDPVEAARRDAAILAGTAPPIPPFPGLADGVLHRRGGAAAPVGQLALQARVWCGGRTALLDDLTGSGWRLLTLDESAGPRLSPPQRKLVDRIGARCVTLSRPGEGEVVDIDGAYRRWMGEFGIVALIVRPDFYVYGAARSLDELPAMLNDLTRQLHLSKDAHA